MRLSAIKAIPLLLAGTLALLVLYTLPALAQEYTSPNYKVDELFIGAGGTNDSASANFRGRASLGDLGVGQAGSSSFMAFAGFTTTTAPELEFEVDLLDVDLGVLSIASPSTTSTKFRVRTYLASGYVVYTEGQPPTSEGGAILDALTGGGTSNPGNEQFGINLVDNTSPNVGTDPVQLPDGTFSFGTVSAGYGTVNNFRYNSGDAIAQSASSSGTTEYTMSYMYNVDELSPAGQYVFRQSLVAVSTF